jgi:hypothetical protein
MFPHDKCNEFPSVPVRRKVFPRTKHQVINKQSLRPF